METTNEVFTFWKNNRKDQQYTLTLDELKEKYLAYLQKQDPEWILYYGHRTVWSFTSADNAAGGLESVTHDLAELEALLVDVRHTLPCYQ